MCVCVCHVRSIRLPVVYSRGLVRQKHGTRVFFIVYTPRYQDPHTCILLILTHSFPSPRSPSLPSLPPSFYTVLFNKRTRFESTRNTRRLGMHRPVMHCFREAIPPAPALRCSAEPRRARFQPSAPVTPWESEFACRKRDPDSIHDRIQLYDTSFFSPLFFLRKYLMRYSRKIKIPISLNVWICPLFRFSACAQRVINVAGSC